MDGHLPLIRITKQSDMQHKSRYMPGMYVKSLKYDIAFI